IARLTMKKQTVTDIVADVVVQEDHVKENTAHLKAFGGTVNASGTEMRLAHPDDPFHLVTKLDNVGLENVVALGSSPKLVAGKRTKPRGSARPEAEWSHAGGMRMDGTLALPGSVSLSPETISTITGGKVKPASAIPVTLKLVGPAWSPSVADLDLKPAVNEIVRQGGAALVGRAFGVDSSKAQQAAEQKAQKVQDEAQ